MIQEKRPETIHAKLPMNASAGSFTLAAGKKKIKPKLCVTLKFKFTKFLSSQSRPLRILAAVIPDLNRRILFGRNVLMGLKMATDF